MSASESQPLPDFVDRREEMRRIRGFIEKAQRSEGHLLIVRGEPGVGKTRLVQEASEKARSRGFTVGCGAGFSESIIPYQPWAEVLRELGLEHIMEELPPPRLLALYLLNSKGSISCKAKLKNAGAATLRTSEAYLRNAVKSSKTSKASILKDGNLTVRVLKSQRTLVLQGKEFSLGAVIKGREDEAFLEDMRELIAAIESRLKKARRSRKSKSKSVDPARELMLKFIEADKYDGIDHARRNPELRKERLFNNIALGIARKASIKPILIILDDLQWTDPSSLSLLQYAARNTRRSAVFILGAYRTEEGAVRPHLSTTLRKISQEDLSTELDLTGLAREYLRDLANSFLGSHDLSEDFLDQLWTETEGNPLFVREVLCRLEEEGAIKLKAKVKQLIRPVKKLDLPNRVREVVRARLKLLPKEDRELLDAAAVCGGRFTASLVARIAGEKESKVVKELNNIARVHGLLQPSGYDFAFNHSTVQEVVHEGLPKKTRQTYHREAAEWLELAGGPVEDVAEHYYQARDKRALAVLYKAASTAREKYANEEALRFYKEALEFEEDAQKKLEILMDLGEIYLLIGKCHNSRDCLEKALHLTEVNSLKAKIKGRIGTVFKNLGDYNETYRTMNEGLELVKGENSKEEAFILKVIGCWYYDKGEFDKALENHEKRLRILKRIGEEKDISGAINDIGNVHVSKGEFDKALECYGQSLEISQRMGFQQYTAIQFGNIGIVHNQKGEYDTGRKYFEKSLSMFEKIGDLNGIARNLQAIGTTYLERGEIKRALEHYKKSLKVNEKIENLGGIAGNLHNIGVIYATRGEYEKALDNCKRSLKVHEKIGLRNGVARNYESIGSIYYGLGEYDRALEYFDKSMAYCEEMDQKELSTYNFIGYARVYLRKCDLKKAFIFADKALNLSKEIGSKLNEATSMSILGEIYGEQEDWNESIGNFETSIKILKRIGHQRTLEEIYYKFGMMWKAKGDIDKAEEHLNKALEIFKKLKLEKRAKKVKAALESLNTKSSSRRKAK